MIDEKDVEARVKEIEGLVELGNQSLSQLQKQRDQTMNQIQSIVARLQGLGGELAGLRRLLEKPEKSSKVNSSEK